MTTELVCRALQHRFRVLVEDDELGGRLRHVLSGLASTQAPASTYHLSGGDLRFDGTDVVRQASPGRAVGMLLWHVNQEAVRRTSPEQVVVHAAAAVRSDVGVLLPAPMEHGKTTTVAGLLRAGFSYVTDEAAALDPETLVLSAFPKALSVDRGSWHVLPELEPPVVLTPEQWQVPPSAMGAPVAATASVRLVVAPTYRHGARTRLVPVSRADMLLTLARCCFEFTARPARNLPVLGRLVASCECYALEVGDLPSAVRLVGDLVESVAAGRAA